MKTNTTNNAMRRGASHRAYMASAGLLSAAFVLFSPAPGLAANEAAQAKWVQAEGEVEVLIEDFANTSRTRHFLNTENGRFELKLKGRAKHPENGAKVRVTGTQSGSYLELNDSGTTSIQVLSPASIPALVGEQKTAVMLVNFVDDASQPLTPTGASNLVFTTVSNWYRENSFQQTWLTGDVFGWATIPVSKSSCDPNKIAAEAQIAAAAAGADLSQYSRLVYMFPTNACTWSGLAGGTGPQSQTQAWINGDLSLRVVAHELGHNFGLLHAHGLDCDSTPLGESCFSYTYGDGTDIMGNGTGHFNAFHKERLGWLNRDVTPPITTITASGTFSLEPYSTTIDKPKALKVLKSTDPTTGIKTWYYIEYRQPIGFDSALATVGNLIKGVVIRTGTDGDADSSQLLDMTPQTNLTLDLKDAALETGRSFRDSAAGITIETLWADSASAGVSVIFDQSNCVRSTPGLALSPAQGPTVVAGTVVTYTLTVTNTDNSACGPSTFDLSKQVPTGWTANLANASLTVSPGAAGTTSFSVTSAATASAGTYGIQASAANRAAANYTVTRSGTYSVATPANTLSETVATNKAIYAKGETVAITATVTAGGKPVANASVSFTITKPTGATVTQTTTTKANGIASYSYRLNKTKDPLGNYQLRADAASGTSSVSAATSFAVQ